MIKKFKIFINESKLINESAGVKTEYQILHLNKEERTEYFINRINDLKDKRGVKTRFKDYEWDLCPKNLKVNYIEEEVMKNGNITYAQFDWCNDALKRRYINGSWSLSNDMLELCSEELKNLYKTKQIELRLSINTPQLSNDLFDFCDYQQKKTYVSAIANTYVKLTDEQYEMCPDDLKKLYFLNKIKKDAYSITDRIFELSSNELKNEYIQLCIDRNININNEKLESCPTELKIKWVNYLFNSKKEMSKGAFKYLDNEQKNIYFKKYPIYENDFDTCNDKQKNDYINISLNQERELTNNQFNFCNAEQKKQYISLAIKNNYDINDDMFNTFSNQEKLIFIDKHINESKGITNNVFNYCSNELKNKYIRSIIYYWENKESDFYGRYLTPIQFRYCSLEDKKLYIIYTIEKEGFFEEEYDIFEVCTENEELQYFYLYQRIFRNNILSDKEFDACTIGLKRLYKEKAEINDYNLSDYQDSQLYPN
jgi:hypothetical protein